MRKALIVVPTYNEQGSIEKLINGIFKQQKITDKWEINILVIDSYSKDETAEIVKKLKKQFSHLYIIETAKEGLGKAYISGFKYGLEKMNPYVIFEMDADLSHNPDDIPRFLKKIEEGADFVVGSRYIKGGSIPSNWGIHRKFLSIFGNFIIKFGFMKLKVADWTSGYRAIKAWLINNALDHIKNYSGYVFQVAFLDFALKNNAKVTEVPINFKERRWGVSKINAIQYIVNSLLYVLFNSSFIKFVIVGMIGFAIDFGISYIGIEIIHKAVWLSTLISTEIAIVSNFLLNNFWSFSHKKIDHHFVSYIFNFIKFNLVSSGSILIQTLGIQLLVMFLGKQWWILYKIFVIFFLIIPYSYILYNKVIWKEKN